MARRDEDGIETAAIDALRSLEGKRVLEVGCGKGRLTTLAASRAASVYSFDPSAKNVAAAHAALTTEQRRRVRGSRCRGPQRRARAVRHRPLRLVVVMCSAKGVVHALRNIDDALGHDGIVVDTQPVSPRPRVASNSGKLGSSTCASGSTRIRGPGEVKRGVDPPPIFAVRRMWVVTSKTARFAGMSPEWAVQGSNLRPWD